MFPPGPVFVVFRPPYIVALYKTAQSIVCVQRLIFVTVWNVMTFLYVLCTLLKTIKLQRLLSTRPLFLHEMKCSFQCYLQFVYG